MATGSIAKVDDIHTTGIIDKLISQGLELLSLSGAEHNKWKYTYYMLVGGKKCIYLLHV